MHSYKFDSSIESLLGIFEDYLKLKKYALDTIRQNRNYAGLYLAWLETEEVGVEEVGYKEFKYFIIHIKSTRSIGHTKRIILAVRHYYQSIDIDKNPASGIHLRGQRRPILNDIVPYQKLIGLYQNYAVLDDRMRRNKVILGLLIYQAITTGELQQLEARHIKLKEGKIYIPGCGKTNGRTLNLDAIQLLELQEYLLEVRPSMLNRITEQIKNPAVAHRRSGRKPAKINPIIYDRLFFSENGNHELKNSLWHLFSAIKKYNPKITSGKIIRSTVIAEWLKTKDIRIVQYMAGHRWVSSTERYNVYNLEELKEQMKKYHPLG